MENPAVTTQSAAPLDQAMGGMAITPYPRSSPLYVGNLSGDITEPALYEFFAQYGQLVSVRVCRDLHSQASLGYGYVNYQNHDDANRVLETLNYTPMRQGGKPMRIMRPQKDATLRKTSNGNVFVKNISKEIDDKSLAEIFTVFGTILSAKVARDRTGASLGYGFIHFKDEANAAAAVKKMNGMTINGVKIFVGDFKHRAERSKEAEETFKNVYMQPVKAEVTESDLSEYFQKFGTITSVCLKSNPKYPTQFGFVNFETHEDARRCIEESNGKTIPEISGTENIFVGRALKIRELVQERQAKAEETDTYDSNKLFIKNLPDSVDDEKLKEMFAPFGELVSATVKVDPETQISKEYGFVAYKDRESAEKALEKMNERTFNGRPLFVNYHQTHEQRRRYLERTLASPIMQGGFFPPQSQPMMGGAYHSAPWPGHPGVMGAGRMGYPPQRGMMPPSVYPPRMGVPQPMRPRVSPQGVVMNAPGQMMGGNGMHPSGRMGGMNRPSAPPMMPQQKNIPGMSGQPQLTSAALANMSPEDQKNALGERLYAAILSIHPENSAKITGMLLEMDTAEILNVLEDNTVLRSKITEALGVLRAHAAE
ncbi:polyadenylate-binding protein 4 [Perkinsela sp. CCAP 1560/4]|nr:polyadenylate-binding protein 4 [Perkinsela sp. CCAP 1560/4]|eukprot:KNH04826.1 polyadenylate-binding protein 4 [Perkinsela sp. CCAP 1560/4]